MKATTCTMALAIFMTACSRHETPASNAPAPAQQAARPIIPSAPPAVSKPSTAPVQAAAQPVTDPKSTDAAAQLTARFVALLNQRKFDEAFMLLGSGGGAKSSFVDSFERYSNLQVTAGTPGDQEGAAGSIYLSIPITVLGDSGGVRVSRSATAILRRVNDVPGSTDAQRHWHIERIDWGSAA